MMTRILILAGVLGVASGPAVADPCVNVTADQAAKIQNLLPSGTWFYQYDLTRKALKGPWKLDKLATVGSGSSSRQVQLNGITMAVGTVYPYVPEKRAVYNLAWAVECVADGYPGAIDLAPAAPVDRSVPSAPVDRSVHWIDRAETALRAMLKGTTGPTIARAVVSRTHRYWKKPRLESYDVVRMDDRISVRITITWQGGIVSYANGEGRDYTTIVVWQFRERGHDSATVTGDGYKMPDATQAQQLDAWFRDELYRVLYQDTGR